MPGRTILIKPIVPVILPRSFCLASILYFDCIHRLAHHVRCRVDAAHLISHLIPSLVSRHLKGTSRLSASVPGVLFQEPYRASGGRIGNGILPHWAFGYSEPLRHKTFGRYPEPGTGAVKGVFTWAVKIREIKIDNNPTRLA